MVPIRMEPSDDQVVSPCMNTRATRLLPSTANLRPTRAERQTTRSCTTLIGILVSLAPACASPVHYEQADAEAPPTAMRTTQGGNAAAPSYEELFTTYFDQGTPGHCATSGCHADPGHNVWLCATKDTCYQGMVDVGLIDLAEPAQSEIADSKRSPLTWINPAGGNMPLDAQDNNQAARAAIEAWVAAGAKND
jgi:hypothetical protein